MTNYDDDTQSERSALVVGMSGCGEKTHINVGIVVFEDAGCAGLGVIEGL